MGGRGRVEVGSSNRTAFFRVENVSHTKGTVKREILGELL